MQTLQHTLDHHYTRTSASLFTRFINWCASQEKNRFVWTALIIALHGCALTPVTALIIVSTGNNIVLLSIAMGAMAIPLATNLAALPTRITIPVFFLSVLIDAVLIGMSL